VRVMGIRRRMERKVSLLMLLYISSSPLCSTDSCACRGEDARRRRVSQQVQLHVAMVTQAHHCVETVLNVSKQDQ
jgi:hypothetical protein